MKRFLLAALLAIALPAGAQALTCVKADTSTGFTLSCAAQGVVTPPPVEPPPPVVPVPPPATGDPCAAARPVFLAALSIVPPLDLWSLQFRSGGTLTEDERACARARNVPGSAIPPPAGNSSTGAPTTGFVLANKGRPLTNTLAANVTYLFSVPNTVTGELVTLQTLEVTGTPDTMQASSLVRGPTGTLLSGPFASSRLVVHRFTSPGGTLTLYVTPNVTAPLGVQRN